MVDEQAMREAKNKIAAIMKEYDVYGCVVIANKFLSIPYCHFPKSSCLSALVEENKFKVMVRHVDIDAGPCELESFAETLICSEAIMNTTKNFYGIFSNATASMYNRAGLTPDDIEHATDRGSASLH